MKDCIFCKMAGKEIIPNTVYEDDLVLAFLDNQPIEKGHVLVVPKNHFENILEIPQDLLTHMYSLTQRIAKAISSSFGVQDFNILQNNGRRAGQTVFHYHIHIIPRYEEFKLCIGNGPMLTDEEIRKGKEVLCSKDICESIREKL